VSPSGVEENLHGGPRTGRWTKREDELLRAAVDEYGEDFKLIADHSFAGQRAEAHIAARWAKVLSVGLRKGQWTEDEDDVVKAEVERGGGALAVKWADVAEQLPGRLGKQVRERWQNHLDPQLSKDPWEEHEDQLLVSLQAVMGNKWSEIARAFAGRSENSVKNRWNSKQRKSLAAERKQRTGNELGVVAACAEAIDFIKIDFGAALLAAHSPHAVPDSQRDAHRLKPAAHRPVMMPVLRCGSPTEGRSGAEGDDDDVRFAGAALIGLLGAPAPLAAGLT
jgi:hypothetical protein